jgi:hypothetical protein
MTLEELDAMTFTASDWEQVILSTETAVVKVVAFDAEYRLVAYKCAADGWCLAKHLKISEPTADDMLDVITEVMHAV